MALGLEAYEAGRWLEARALFLRGHKLMPNARSLRALGMAAFNLDMYLEAFRELSAALNEQHRPLTGRLRLEAELLLDRTDIFVGRYRLYLEPAHASLKVDGAQAQLEPDGSLLLMVGKHLLEAEALGYDALERAVLVDGTDGETLRLELRGTPPRPRVLQDYPWTWAMAGSAVAFAGTSIALRVLAQRENEALTERCAEEACYPGVTERRDRLAAWSAGLFVGSLLAVLSAGVAALIEHQHATKPRHPDTPPGVTRPSQAPLYLQKNIVSQKDALPHDPVD